MNTDDGFVDLVKKEHRGVMAASMMIVGSSALAEEIVQDVFERAYIRWSKVSRLDRPGAWVRRAVINQSISMTRKSKSERRAVERLAGRDHSANSHSIDGTGSAVGSGHDLWKAVAELPPNQARAVALHYGADLSLASVALELELTESAVKTLLYRARCTLRDHATVKEIHR
ncbi:MAG TPA: sigma-70 family RNA polymerase sigma factor [Microthrixaceae bacterium]|nr:sigma-70 family RNA polymerase sigma factor [Microthrixaceae bacterium]